MAPRAAHRSRLTDVVSGGILENAPALVGELVSERITPNPKKRTVTMDAGLDTGTTADTEAVEALIRNWADAVQVGDLDRVLAAHAEDIVMFDVPAPENGVRGIENYRRTWPPFFDWQAQGACFDIVELDVTVGADVGYAFALLRCGTSQELEQDPQRRLRLTIGLRKLEGRWTVAHEHHSFVST